MRACLPLAGAIDAPARQARTDYERRRCPAPLALKPARRGFPPIQTAINVMGMPPHDTMMIQGTLVLAAVLLDTAKNGLRRRYL